MAFGTPLNSGVKAMKAKMPTHCYAIPNMGNIDNPFIAIPGKRARYGVTIGVPHGIQNGFYMKMSNVFFPYWGQEPDEWAQTIKAKQRELQERDNGS